MPRTRKATLGAAGATLCATALLGGATGTAHAQDDNGVAGKSAADIAAQAEDAFNGARSMHVTLERQGPGLDRDDPATLDLTADRSDNCVGTIGYAAGGGSMEIIRHGEQVWLKPDAAWMKTNLPADQARAAQKLEGKYFQGSIRDEGVEDLAEICDIDEFRDTLQDATSAASLEKGGESTIDGTPVVEVRGRGDDGTDMTLSVATQGTPYPVRATANGDGEQQTENFSFDEPVPDKTPSAGETVPWNG